MNENKVYPVLPQSSVMKTYDDDGKLVSEVPVTYGAQPLPGYHWDEVSRFSSSSDDSSTPPNYYSSYGGAAATVGYIESNMHNPISRRNFIIKVLLTVSAMVSVMVGMTFWFLYDYNVGCTLTSEWYLYYVFTLLVPLVGLVIFCSDTLTRRWPLNLFVLIFWTFIMSAGYAFLANLWAVNSGSKGACKVAFCAAAEVDCKSYSSICESAEICAGNAAGTMGISLGVIIVVLLIGVCLALAGIDLFNISTLLTVIFLLLLLPCGFLGYFLLPYDWYFGFVCALMIYTATIGIWTAIRLMIDPYSGFHPDEWVRASMYIFHLGRSFDLFKRITSKELLNLRDLKRLETCLLT